MRAALRRRPAALLLAALLVLVAGVGLVASAGGPAPSRAVGPGSPGQSVPAGVATPAGSEPPPGRPAISIPAVGLHAPMVPVRFEGNELAPPDDVSRAGLWIDGAPLAAGGRGSTVVVGHVSDGQDRPGEFGKLWEVVAGMEAVTRDARGRVKYWRAERAYRVEKDDLPRSLFLEGTSRRLVLITCASRVSSGGRFHYEDNLVVELAPA